MNKILKTVGLLVLALAVGVPAAAEVGARETFERLKEFEGLWKGTPRGSGEAEGEAGAMSEAVHRFEVSAAGTVVMETMAPDTQDEMINMYFLDGDDLVLTHYCSSGNQPRMRLNSAQSTAETMVFDFDGGTNLEGAPHHIHSAKIELAENGGMVSRWYGASGGEVVGEMAFHLERAPAQ